MDAKKKKSKKVKVYPYKNLPTQKEVEEKGLIPYVDYYPLPGVKKTDFYWSDPDKKITSKQLRRDGAKQIAHHGKDKWGAVMRVAKNLFSTPQEAMEILLRESTLFKTRDSKTFILCAMIENDMKASKQPLNKTIEINLDKYCPLIGVDYTKVETYTAREIQKDSSKSDRNKFPRQTIINRIVEKHRRLVKQKPKEFKDWIKKNGHLIK